MIYATDNHRSQLPGVTELVVHDLLNRPHKSTSQQRMAYTITVTGIQKVLAIPAICKY